MKTSSKSKSISVYRNQNVHIAAVFKRANDPRKVLCVALDFAKRKHLALICDGNGDVLKAPFPVHNNNAGVDFLIEQVRASANRRKIPDNQIFFGGEDSPSYVANFNLALREQGFATVRVSARLASENRENTLASTDKIDAFGIAKTLLSRRASSTFADGEQNPAYHHLRELMRARRSLVRYQTATANRIHALADQLFPEFLDETRSGITKFSNPCLAIMKERFSAPEIARRKPTAFARMLSRMRLQHPDEKAAKIIDLARNALPPDPAKVATLQRTLSAAVDLHRCLTRNADALLTEAAQTLATTPYVMLTSVPGISFVLASGVAVERGDPRKLAPLDSLCAYAGVVPQTYQSGGPDSPAAQGSASPRCNHILKDYVVQSSQKIRLMGPPELKDRINRWEANGQHGIFAGARRYLRLTRTLAQNGIPYLDPAARSRDHTSPEYADAAQQSWKVMQNKWRTIPGGIELLLNSEYPAGFWRELLKEVHQIHLPERV